MTQKLTILELNAAREFFHRADILVADARSRFFDVEDCTTAARPKDIERRLQDEVHSIERVIAAADQSAFQSRLASKDASDASRSAPDQCLKAAALLHAARRRSASKELAAFRPSAFRRA